MELKTILNYLVALITISGGVFTIYTYWKNSKLKRSEWLYNLYEKFYEKDNYKRIRYIIDYEREEDIKRLKRGVLDDCEDELVEELVDYLNFFEFIASLWVMKQLTSKEIAMVFEYYILRIYDHDFIVKFLNDEGFKQLPLLVAKLSEQK